MKKITSALTILTLLFSLTACSPTSLTACSPTDQPNAEGTDEMYIQKAELTEEEQALIEFLGSEKEPYIWNFSVDGTVRCLQINTYELRGNKWRLIGGGGGEELSEPKGRMAFTFDNIGLRLRTAIEYKGYTDFQSGSEFGFEGLDTQTSYLTDKTTIEYEKEIPLVIQIHTSKNEISAPSIERGFYEPQTYADSGYEKVYAITCRFSQKTVGEQPKRTEP